MASGRGRWPALVSRVFTRARCGAGNAIIAGAYPVRLRPGCACGPDSFDWPGALAQAVVGAARPALAELTAAVDALADGRLG